MPPRSGKTEIINTFIEWSITKHPKSKYIMTSYSDTLVANSSQQIRDMINSLEHKELFNLETKKDTQSKKLWKTNLNGGVYAVSSFGQITGFGAGLKSENEWGGCIIVDDPLKPDDALSEVKRKTINERYNNTIRSRVNDRDTPIIVIMQRLHEDDMSGFLLNGGSGEEWTHLCMPVLDEHNQPLWEAKHNFQEIERIRQADRYTFSGQYMQTPSPDEGGEWKKHWFPVINREDLSNDIKWTLYIDGAYTKDTKNDPTGLQISGKHNNNLYILSSIDKYLEMPELIKYIPNYIDSLGVKVNMTKVEPKASGKSIVQLIRSQTNLNITEIKTNFVKVSKIERARTSTPYIEGGRVILVRGAWNEHFLNQVAIFPNGKHDEHIDLTAYSVEENLLQDNSFTPLSW